MADDLPAKGKLVPAVLELIALALVLGAEEAWRADKSWYWWVSEGIAGLLCQVGVITWSRVVSFVLAYKRILTRCWPMIAVATMMLVTCAVVGYGVYDRRNNQANLPAANVADMPSEKPTKFRLTVAPPDVFISQGVSMSGVVVTASIWNTGKPSIATQWSLTVAPPDGAIPITRDCVPINPAGLKVGGINSGFVITQTDDISLKTKQTKITETPIDGSVRFYIPLPKAVIENSVIRLTVRDLTGSEFSATYSPR